MVFLLPSMVLALARQRGRRRNCGAAGKRSRRRELLNSVVANKDPAKFGQVRELSEKFNDRKRWAHVEGKRTTDYTDNTDAIRNPNLEIPKHFEFRNSKLRCLDHWDFGFRFCF